MLPVFDGRSWLGDAEAYGTWFTVGLWESPQHPGFYHYAIWCDADDFYDGSKMPIRINAFCPWAARMVEKHTGLTFAEFLWTEVSLVKIPFEKEGAAS